MLRLFRLLRIGSVAFGLLSVGFATVSYAQSMGAGSGGAWIQADAADCALWAVDPEPGDAVSWSGACLAGRADGPGIAFWTRDGTTLARYQGELRAGRRHGAGLWVDREGLRYEGHWRHGEANGLGTLETALGDRYSGAFKDRRFHGYGVWRSAKGERYDGRFLAGKFHGQGTLTYAEGGGYVGRFGAGLFEGQGVLLLVTGQGFIGEFRANRPHSQGLCTFANEAPRVCLFDGGAFVAWAN